jgi:hypothetical protein
MKGVKKMKVSVNVALYYNYETEIPDDTKENDLLWTCDVRDPVYIDIVKAMLKTSLDYDTITTSIIKEDTDEILYSV